MKHCRKCNTVITKDNTKKCYRNIGLNEATIQLDTICRKCHNIQKNHRCERKIIRAKKFGGGKCVKCDYNKNFAALDFHHKENKVSNVSRLCLSDASWKRIQTEINKCILLCSNCHRELHNPKYTM
jgi:hypothetical protein